MWVPIEKMFVAQYGRQLSDTKIAKLRKRWDPKKVGTLLLSYRHEIDMFAVLDGQHRMIAAMEEGMVELPSRVYLDLTYEQEADLYVGFATVNPQTAYDRLVAMYEAGDQMARSIKAILDYHGLKWGATNGPATIAAASALMRCYQSYGPDILSLGLGILKEAWGLSEMRAWNNEQIVGITMFLQRYKGLAQRSRIIDKLKLIGPEGMLSRTRMIQGGLKSNAGQGRYRATAWCLALRDAYNAHLQKGALPEWQVVSGAAAEALALKQARDRGEDFDWPVKGVVAMRQSGAQRVEVEPGVWLIEGSAAHRQILLRKEHERITRREKRDANAEASQDTATPNPAYEEPVESPIESAESYEPVGS